MCSNSYKKEKGFALITVLLLLLLLLVLSIGIIVSTQTGLQRSSAFQDSNISYMNAISGANMVVSYFERLPDPPDWITPTGDLGSVLSFLPSILQNDYELTVSTASGTYVSGIFRLISADRIGGVPGDLPQDFEVVVAGFMRDGDEDTSETRIRVRVRLAPEIEFAYFMHDVPSNVFWVSQFPTRPLPTTRFYGRVHSNGSVTMTADNVQSDLFPGDPVFHDWGDHGYASILSVWRGATPKPLTFHGSGPADWDFRATYPFDLNNDDITHPNYAWYGVAGMVDHDNDLNFGGFGGAPTEIDLDADYIPFPDVNTDLRSIIWNGDPTSAVPNAAPGSSERVRIPDNTRPDGGIFVHGDASIHFQAGDFVGNDSEGNPVYNNILLIQQPYTHRVEGVIVSEILHWRINVYRDSSGNIIRISRDFYPNEQKYNDNDPSLSQEYEGNIGDRGFSIYVDGNIGWADMGPNDRRDLQYFGDRRPNGIPSIDMVNHIGAEVFRGLSGETYGMWTIVSSYDMLITDHLIYAGYDVPMDLDDYTDDHFKNLQTMTGLIGRNVFVVPKPVPTGDNYEPFEINALVFAHGFALNSGNFQDKDRNPGVFANIVYYQNVGAPAVKSGFTNGNRDRLVHGIMVLKGAVMNWEMGVMTIKQQFQDGMYERYYFDKRLSLIKPMYMPGTNQGALIFEWVRLVSQI